MEDTSGRSEGGTESHPDTGLMCRTVWTNYLRVFLQSGNLDIRH